MIEITNSNTHEFKQLADAPAVAEFLAGRDDAGDWTGHEPHVPTGETAPVDDEAPQAAKAPAKKTSRRK